MIQYVKRWVVTPPAYVGGHDLWAEKRNLLHVEIMGVEGDGIFQECNDCHHSMTKHEKTELKGGHRRTGAFRRDYTAYCIFGKEEGYPYDLCACTKIFVEIKCKIIGVEL